jgi:hypothetical protein
MPEVAFVTRTFGSRTFQTQGPDNVGNETGVGYALRTATGQNLGTYRSVSEAQAAFSRRHGPNRILKWKQQNLQGDIEQHVAIGLPLSPREIWLDNLIDWLEPDLVPGSVMLQNVVDGTIRRVNDLSATSNYAEQTVLVEQPELNENDSGFNGRASILFAGAESMLTPNLTTLSPPYTVFVVARSTVDDGGDPFIVDTAGDDLHIGGDGAGAWELVVGASSLTAGVTPPLADAAILVARVTDTLTEFRLNGESQGSIAGIPADDGTFIIGRGVDLLTGSIAAAMIAIGETEPNDARILQTERYFNLRYR